MIGIVLEGGLVSAVISDCKDDINKDFVVIDYDTDGCEDDPLVDVIQTDGSTSKANVWMDGIHRSMIEIPTIISTLEHEHCHRKRKNHNGKKLD